MCGSSERSCLGAHEESGGDAIPQSRFQKVAHPKSSWSKSWEELQSIHGVNYVSLPSRGKSRGREKCNLPGENKFDKMLTQQDRKIAKRGKSRSKNDRDAKYADHKKWAHCSRSTRGCVGG